jgi:hypothetical protein
MTSLAFTKSEATARLDQERYDLKQAYSSVLQHLMHDANILTNGRDIGADETFMVLQRLQAQLLQYARARAVDATVKQIKEKE